MESKDSQCFLSSKLLATEGRAADMEAGQSASEQEGKLDLYSVIFFFSSVSLNYGLQHPVCHYSTNQHLIEEYIYKPSASGAI